MENFEKVCWLIDQSFNLALQQYRIIVICRFIGVSVLKT